MIPALTFAYHFQREENHNNKNIQKQKPKNKSKLMALSESAFTSTNEHKEYTMTSGKQEAHGPYRSPEKTVQFNKHIRLYHNINKRREDPFSTF